VRCCNNNIKIQEEFSFFLGKNKVIDPLQKKKENLNEKYKIKEDCLPAKNREE
jgi:hypothetical protein